MKNPPQSRRDTDVSGCPYHLVDELETLRAIPQYSTIHQLRHGTHGLTGAEIDNCVHVEIIEALSQDRREVQHVMSRVIE